MCSFSKALERVAGFFVSAFFKVHVPLHGTALDINFSYSGSFCSCNPPAISFPGEYVRSANIISLPERQGNAFLVAAVLWVRARALPSSKLSLGFCFLGCIRGYFLAWSNWRQGSFAAGGRGGCWLISAFSLLQLTKTCLLEALVLGGANQVTGMCSCLVAKAISWSSRRQQPGQQGNAGTLWRRGAHYLPTWQSLGLGAALAGCSFANRCLCSSRCGGRIGDILSASSVCAAPEGRWTLTVSWAPAGGIRPMSQRSSNRWAF